MSKKEDQQLVGDVGQGPQSMVSKGTMASKAGPHINDEFRKCTLACIRGSQSMVSKHTRVLMPGV